MRSLHLPKGNSRALLARSSSALSFVGMQTCLHYYGSFRRHSIHGEERRMINLYKTLSRFLVAADLRAACWARESTEYRLRMRCGMYLRLISGANAKCRFVSRRNLVGASQMHLFAVFSPMHEARAREADTQSSLKEQNFLA